MVGGQLVLDSREVVHLLPCLLAGLVPRGRDEPVLR